MAAYDVVTLDEVKVALGVDGTALDEVLARAITDVTLRVEARLGTQFVQRSVVEYHVGGERRIYPQRTPIASVTSIVDPASNTVPSTDYLVRQRRWIEHYSSFPHGYATTGQATDLTVTYTAGWFASASAVTADVKAEIIRAISALRETPPTGLASVSVGGVWLSFSPSRVPAAAIEEAAGALYAYRGVLL